MTPYDIKFQENNNNKNQKQQNREVSSLEEARDLPYRQKENGTELVKILKENKTKQKNQQPKTMSTKTPLKMKDGVGMGITTVLCSES